MLQFFAILLKINLVLLLFAGTYYLVLRRLTFYKTNRIFLVFGILFSSVYPFVDMAKIWEQYFAPKTNAMQWVPSVKQQLIEVMDSRVVLLCNIGLWLFVIGLILMAVRLFIQLKGLYSVHKGSTPGYLGNYKVRFLAEKLTPFAFWQNVYINPGLHRPEELDTILQHEYIHVKEWHTLDILLAEISLVFYWFNPGVWLIKNAVKENLEFITDEKILTKGTDRKTYQYSLLGVSQQELQNPALVNHFNLNDLKKRISMMNKKRSSKLKFGLYFVLLPVLVVLASAFAIDKKAVQNQVKVLKSLPVISKELVGNLIEKPAENIFREKAIEINKQKLGAIKKVKPDTASFNMVQPNEVNQKKIITIKVNGQFFEGKPISNTDTLIATVANRLNDIVEKLKPSLVKQGYQINDDIKGKVDSVVLVRTVIGRPSSYPFISEDSTKASISPAKKVLIVKGVKLKEDIKPEDIKEITVVGYGTAKKSLNITTSKN